MNLCINPIYLSQTSKTKTGYFKIIQIQLNINMKFVIVFREQFLYLKRKQSIENHSIRLFFLMLLRWLYCTDHWRKISKFIHSEQRAMCRSFHTFYMKWAHCLWLPSMAYFLWPYRGEWEIFMYKPFIYRNEQRRKPRANMPHKILSDPNKIRRNPWYRNPIGSCGTSENVGILQIR